VIIRILLCSIVMFICLLASFFCRHAYVDVARAVDWKGSEYWLKFYFISCTHIMPGMVGMVISFRRSQFRFLLWSIPTILVALYTLMLWREPPPWSLESGPPLSAAFFHIYMHPLVFLNPLYYFQSVNLFSLRQAASFVFFAVAFLDICTIGRSRAGIKVASGTEPSDAPKSSVNREFES